MRLLSLFLLCIACSSRGTPAEIDGVGGRTSAAPEGTNGGKADGASPTAGVSAYGGRPGQSNPDGGEPTTQCVSSDVDSDSPSLVAKGITFGGNACALLDDDTVRCWGGNDYGQVGNGTTATSGCYCSPTPSAVIGLNDIMSVATGDSHACAVLSDGTIQCWGLNVTGELGNGIAFPPNNGSFPPPPINYSPIPVAVVGISNAVTVALGHQHTCALLQDGTVQCWGDDSYGELGIGQTRMDSSTPVPVIGVTNAVAVAAGGYDSCALISDGTIQCWGENMSGQLGNGTMYYQVGEANDSPTAVTVAGITNAVGLAVDGSASCALLRDGHVWCWGFGYGYASDNPLTNMPIELSPDVPGYVSASALPAAIQGVSNVISLSYGCAVLQNHTVECWHTDATQGTYGNPGPGDPTVSGPPVLVPCITDAAAVAGDVSNGCALLRSGSVQCWGSQLGNGTTTDIPVPVTVVGF